MSLIRDLRPDDMPDVVELFLRSFPANRQSSPHKLKDYFERLYGGANLDSDGFVSKVSVGEGGITGFIGIGRRGMVMDGRPIEAAVISTLMVDRKKGDPTIAARLLRAAREGPQQLTFSETASGVSVSLWTRSGGKVLHTHSFEWLRLFGPMQYVVDRASSRVPWVVGLGGVASGLDTIANKFALGPESWRRPEAPRGCTASPVTSSEMSALLMEFAKRYKIAPAWGAAELDEMLAEARHKSAWGDLVLGRVADGSGRVLGIFAYHARARRVGRVLQILSLPRACPQVLDAMLAYAAAQGLAGLSGRTDAALLEAMADGPFLFASKASTVVDSRDPGILQMVLSGDALLHGFAGESWNALNGNVLS